MLVASQRMADQDSVGFRRVQRPIGLIGDLQRPEIDASVHFQRLVGAETRHEAMRGIRLELAQSFLVGNNCHDHLRSL